MTRILEKSSDEDLPTRFAVTNDLSGRDPRGIRDHEEGDGRETGRRAADGDGERGPANAARRCQFSNWTCRPSEFTLSDSGDSSAPSSPPSSPAFCLIVASAAVTLVGSALMLIAQLPLEATTVV